MSASEPSTAIACNLDALSPAERTRRAELAQTLQKSATSLEETRSGYRVQLPDDPGLSDLALQLIQLERRCCPFLALGLAFGPGPGAVALEIGGPPGVKEFLAENGVLGCASLPERPSCC